MYSQILPVCLFVCFSCIFSLSSSSSVLSPPLKVNFLYFLSSAANANLFSSCPSCISFSIFLVLRFQSSFFFCLLFQVFSFFKVCPPSPYLCYEPLMQFRRDNEIIAIVELPFLPIHAHFTLYLVWAGGTYSINHRRESAEWLWGCTQKTVVSSWQCAEYICSQQ